MQNAGAAVMRPFEVGRRTASPAPFRDAYSWFDGLVGAKREQAAQARGRAAAPAVRQRADRAEREHVAEAAARTTRIGPSFPKDFRPGRRERARARLRRRPEQRRYLRRRERRASASNDPVVTRDGLVGRVTRVAPGLAQVTLLTDATSAVAASDLRRARTGSCSTVPAAATQLILGRVPKAVVKPGDFVVTAGSQLGARSSTSTPRDPDRHASRASYQNDIDKFKQIQVEPYADFSSLDSVVVLVPLGRK